VHSQGRAAPDNAHKFINYLLDAKAGAEISKTILYPTPNAAAKALMPPEYRDNPVIFPSADQLAKCEYGAFEGAEKASLYEEVKPPPVGEAIAKRSVGGVLGIVDPGCGRDPITPPSVGFADTSPTGGGFMLLLIMLPFWTNLLIRTYALIAVLRNEGYINKGLEAIWTLALDRVLPLAPFQPLEMMHTNFAVIVGLVYVHLPFMVLPLYSALDRLDKSLLEASLDLGAGHMRTLFKVVVPLALPGIASGILITFIPALGAYLTPDLLGGPDSQMIANVIERQFKRANDWPFGAALSFLLMYLTFVAIAVQAMLGRKKGVLGMTRKSPRGPLEYLRRWQMQAWLAAVGSSSTRR
jgi:ABC-type spermidine/putrescine transport system permease subunit I